MNNKGYREGIEEYKENHGRVGHTGLISHEIDWPPSWFAPQAKPVVSAAKNSTSVPHPEQSEELVEETPQSPDIELSAPSSTQIPPELESLLKAILEGVLARTDDPEIIQSAKNLLDICRDQFREGKPDVAWGNARYLQKQIPDYLTQRIIP